MLLMKKSVSLVAIITILLQLLVNSIFLYYWYSVLKKYPFYVFINKMHPKWTDQK